MRWLGQCKVWPFNFQWVYFSFLVSYSFSTPTHVSAQLISFLCFFFDYFYSLCVCLSIMHRKLPIAICELRSLAKKGDKVLGSVRTSVRPPIRLWTLSQLKKSHYQSKVFVCVSNNCTDVVDLLLYWNDTTSIVSISSVAQILWKISPSAVKVTCDDTFLLFIWIHTLGQLGLTHQFFFWH